MSSIAALLCSCTPETWNLDITGMFCGSSPGIDTRIDDSFRYNEEHGFPVIFANDEEYKTYICTDTPIALHPGAEAFYKSVGGIK